MDILDMIFATCDPAAPAVLDGDGRITDYGTLLLLASSVAERLEARGIKAGDAVGIDYGRTRDYLAAQLGILMVGAAAVPLVPEYPQKRKEEIFGDCGAKLVLDGGFFPLNAAKSPYPFAKTEESADAVYLYTSSIRRVLRESRRASSIRGEGWRPPRRAIFPF